MTSTMDLLGEGDTGSRILTARHISGEKSLGINNAVNTTLLCHSYSVQPDFGTYLAGKKLPCNSYEQKLGQIPETWCVRPKSGQGYLTAKLSQH